ncbi:MAG: hypothetical protein PHD81_00765 [Candidatus Nanoarchaeia archaeon]|nr:hypothetical protein [Candidatus Nanoarchaeia archaeon]MDD5587622.1 hypothetical protein [Candidatus Nanoarchaeia archaeon]
MLPEEKTETIEGKTWDAVQIAVREYAKKNNLDVSPKEYLPLEDASYGFGLNLSNPEGLISLASFYPYRKANRKIVTKVKFYENNGLEAFLEELKDKTTTKVKKR